MSNANLGLENQTMYTAYVLVKNFISNERELKFSEFSLIEIHPDTDVLEKAKNLFSVGVPHFHDWIYERRYYDIKVNQWEKISSDIEDTLFLLRLFKVGDLVFIRPCIQAQDGNLMRQLPYRVMSDIATLHDYELQSDETSKFDQFASEMILKKELACELVSNSPPFLSLWEQQRV